jgi:Asp/Glu/hydantoin racemase
MHGLKGRLAAIRMVDSAVGAISDVQEEREALLIDLARSAVTEDGADVVIFAGAPLAGLASRVRDRLPVPCIDQMGAAIKQAEALVALRPRKAETGTFRRPDAKPSVGLSPGLAARISRSD